MPASRGFGGTVIAVLAALSLGAAASYGYLRWSQPDLTAQTAALREENDSLQQALGEMQAKLEQSTRSATQADEARLAAEAALRQAETAGATRDPEIAALRERLADQANELDAMAEKLANVSATGANAEAAAAKMQQQLRHDIQELTARLQEARARAETAEAERDRLAKELAIRNDSVLESEGAAQRELAQLQQEVLPGLRAERDRLSQELTDQTAQKSELQTRFDALVITAEADRAARTRLNAELRDARTRIAALEQNLTAQQAAGATSPPAAEPQRPTDEPPTVPGRTPRNSLQVDNALNRAPGLGSLTTEQVARLKGALIEGACVTDALDAVFDRVPVITLRNLIRDLQSDC